MGTRRQPVDAADIGVDLFDVRRRLRGGDVIGEGGEEENGSGEEECGERLHADTSSPMAANPSEAKDTKGAGAVPRGIRPFAFLIAPAHDPFNTPAARAR